MCRAHDPEHLGTEAAAVHVAGACDVRFHASHD